MTRKLFMNQNKTHYIWGMLRIAMGWTFFWSFIDNLFGLGFSTTPEKSWLAGGSPTFGFLNFASKGPFAEFYQGLAGHPVVDMLFMVGLSMMGLALMFGVGVKIASYGGALMMILMYSAVMPPEHNPFLDKHIVYVIIFMGLVASKSGHYIGFGKYWSNTALVKKYSFLE